MIKSKRKSIAIRVLPLVVALAMISWNTLLSAGNVYAFSAPESFSQLAESAKPGVVNIRTVKTIKGGSPVFRHFFGSPFGNKRNPFDEFFGPFQGNGQQRDFKQRSLGSGFLIDKDGYIVTNNHVIEDADQIKVILADDKEFDAELVGRDSKTDLALIHIKGAKNLDPLELGDSDDLKVGTWVVAIGSPFGLEQTVTAGIVSAKGRIIGSGPYDDFIQTDASINPGNSGGPLLNMDGEVVGINTAIIASGQGIGFAIPINLARGIIDQLKDKGEVTRGWLGVGIQDLTPELAEYYGLKAKEGVLVTQVFDGDPAGKAGIQVNDVILSVDGKRVATGRELSSVIANTAVGHKTAIELIRDGRPKSLTVTLAKRDDDDKGLTTQSRDSEEMGIDVTDLDSDLARRFGIDGKENGVLVTDIKEDSLAQEADIRPGDIIKEINRAVVKDRNDFIDLMKKNKDKASIQLLIKRRNAGYLVVKIERK
ncbi:DegQ family serine endoprotease [Desulfosarcina ovata]|uniref:Peptidase n=2 Tax=Desulfosarcina ovata TaxID=83564 RepID=A0A5K8AJZ0_9BACT|nr:DegQ family serine endoprotease [Desulfosarcina ovata]BBO86089.1 peptidase [Desulfosarcina ovata subsp. sediminis]BBO93025.1 peptidase [Desulfosarcina ovata subsp. ovata]